MSRIFCRCEHHDIELSLDVANELFPLEVGRKILIVLTKTLSLEPEKEQSIEEANKIKSWKPITSGSLLDSFKYCMHGKIYKYVESASNKMYPTLSLFLVPSVPLLAVY